MDQIKIIYEDEQVVVIDKPPGLLVHEEKSGDSEPTVVTWLLVHAPQARGVGEPQYDVHGNSIDRSGVVHRLDRGTSGVLILAKTQSAYEHLKAQFHDRLAKKEYQAIVYGYFSDITGHIRAKIGRVRNHPRKRSAFKTAVGTLRDAVTDWELITQNANFAYVRLLPKTGRTHQLRAHLTFLAHPIVGDGLYASKKQLAATKNVPRMLLHARTLTVTLENGTAKTFTAELPVDFITFVAEHITTKK